MNGAGPRKSRTKADKRRLEPRNRSKRMKRLKPNSRKNPSRYLNEYAEYESSRMNFGKSREQIQRIPSDNSVIYVKTYSQRDNIPIIDLTKSSHSGILYTTVSSQCPSTTSLKLVYKSSNFNNKVQQKHPSTSLLTIPSRRSMERIRNLFNTSSLTRCTQKKLSILEIPPEYRDNADGSEYAFHDLSKADLDEEDRSMIECIAMKKDNEGSSAYGLESKQPIENMCQLYGVTSHDNFD